MRPQSINDVEQNLLELARLGGISWGGAHSAWLRSVGAVQDGSSRDWLYTNLSWLAAVEPATGPLDLLRRTAVLDPQYRFHLDLLLAQVLQTIGSAARWSRFDELIFGALLPFAPRFVQLLELASSTTNMPPFDLSTSCWEKLALRVEEDGNIFQQWDCELWGDLPGGAAALFPLLVDLYIPLRRSGCCVAADRQRFDEPTAELLAAIIERASHGEGIDFEMQFEPRLKNLLSRGLPIRTWASLGGSSDRRAVVGLVEPVRFIWAGKNKHSSEGLPLLGTDRNALKTARIEGPPAVLPDILTEGFWTVIEQSVPAVAFPGLCLSEEWPAEPRKAPVWAEVPASHHLRAANSARRDSQDADQALFMLARHVLFGLLIQIFILESLDRELGHDSLVLNHTNQEETELFVNVRVFYRPTQDSGPDADQRTEPAYEVGDFDDVVSLIADSLGIAPAGPSLDGDSRLRWSAAVRLMASVGLVTLSPLKDRWTLHSDVLDRLHGGGLMSGVLRRGKAVRDRIRGHLLNLWFSANDLNLQSGASDD